MTERLNIHVFLPAYNEANVIGDVVRRIIKCGYDNVYVIDDGSTDNTEQIAHQNGAMSFKHLINRGAGAATQTAISYARRRNLNYIVFLDGDGQHFPEDIDRMYDLMKKSNADLIIGSRFTEHVQSVPLHRRMYNFIAKLLTVGVQQTKYTDTQCGFRMLNRKAIECINLEIDGYGFASEMLWKAEQNKLIIKEIPVQVVYTEHSLENGQDFITGIKTGFDLMWEKLGF